MKVFSVTLENTAAPDNAPYKEKYRSIYVRAESFAAAVVKAETHLPNMKVTALDITGDAFIE